MKRLCVILMLTFLISLEGKSQDVQFSQFYNVPLFLNPGFAGSAHQTRATAHHRMQWPGLNARYTTSLVALDHYVPQHKSGFGLMVMQDYMGGNTITSTDVALQYSYEIHIVDNLTFRPGIQLGYLSRYLNYSNLMFPQQFTDDDGQVSFTDPYGFGSNRTHMIDFGTGGIFYSKEFWFGFSGHHINRPNQSFVGEVSRLPAKFAFVSGYKIKIKGKGKYMAYLQDEKEIAIIPTLNYKFQGSSDQIDIGVYGIYDQVIAGIWYRGIPTKKYTNILHNNESLILMGGFKFGNYSLSYSYDYVVSRLSSVRTLGAHELNFTFINSKKPKKNRPMKRLPCPSFYR